MSNALPVIKDLHHPGGVLYFYMAAHVSVGHAVIVFIDSQINVADLLDFGPLIVAQLIPSRRQWIQGQLLELKELLAACGGPVLEAVVVVRPQQLTDGLIKLGQAEEGSPGQRVIDTPINQLNGSFDQRFVLRVIRARRMWPCASRG